ncbi:unnamed protein product [Natator depressus]
MQLILLLLICALLSFLSWFTLTPSSCLPFLTRGNSTHGPHCPRGILKARDPADLVFLSRSTLVQYVDDLLLCSPSLSASETDSLVLLTALANKGHKASRSKLQLCQASVTYLGFLLSQGSHALSPTRVQAILSFPRPRSPSQVQKFLGMAGFCRQWIPQYASLAKPLQELTRFSVPDPMPWPPEANSAFVSLKQGLASAPALGLPILSLLPFSATNNLGVRLEFSLRCTEKRTAQWLISLPL